MDLESPDLRLELTARYVAALIDANTDDSYFERVVDQAQCLAELVITKEKEKREQDRRAQAKAAKEKGAGTLKMQPAGK